MELKNLLLRMIHADYKVRPSAKEVLDNPIIRKQVNDRVSCSFVNIPSFSFRSLIYPHHLHSINIDMNM